jgi:hypothetical protein
VVKKDELGDGSDHSTLPASFKKKTYEKKKKESQILTRFPPQPKSRYKPTPEDEPRIGPIIVHLRCPPKKKDPASKKSSNCRVPSLSFILCVGFGCTARHVMGKESGFSSSAVSEGQRVHRVNYRIYNMYNPYAVLQVFFFFSLLLASSGLYYITPYFYQYTIGVFNLAENGTI